MFVRDLGSERVFAKRRVRWLMHIQLAASSNFLRASSIREAPSLSFLLPSRSNVVTMTK